MILVSNERKKILIANIIIQKYFFKKEDSILTKIGITKLCLRMSRCTWTSFSVGKDEGQNNTNKHQSFHLDCIVRNKRVRVYDIYLYLYYIYIIFFNNMHCNLIYLVYQLHELNTDAFRKKICIIRTVYKNVINWYQKQKSSIS